MQYDFFLFVSVHNSITELLCIAYYEWRKIITVFITSLFLFTLINYLYDILHIYYDKNRLVLTRMHYLCILFFRALALSFEQHFFNVMDLVNATIFISQRHYDMSYRSCIRLPINKNRHLIIFIFRLFQKINDSPSEAG